MIKKVVDAELDKRVTISSEDISQYYKKNFQNRELESDSTRSSEDINEAIVEQLRREKKIQAYKPWIEELKSKYVIEISSEQWEKITASSGIDNNEADTGKSKND